MKYSRNVLLQFAEWLGEIALIEELMPGTENSEGKKRGREKIRKKKGGGRRDRS